MEYAPKDSFWVFSTFFFFLPPPQIWPFRKNFLVPPFTTQKSCQVTFSLNSVFSPSSFWLDLGLRCIIKRRRWRKKSFNVSVFFSRYVIMMAADSAVVPRQGNSDLGPSNHCRPVTIRYRHFEGGFKGRRIWEMLEV